MAPERTTTRREEWHLQKGVPISLIAVILVQTLGAGWWASNVDERVTQIERRLSGFAEREQSSDQRVMQLSNQVSVLTERVESTMQHINRLTAELTQTNELLLNIVRGESRND